jgi:hypothetical protein
MSSVDKLRIVDYFDSVINEIDQLAEKLIQSYERQANGDAIQSVNDSRHELIKAVKSCEKCNFEYLYKTSNKQLTNQELFKTFCFVITQESKSQEIYSSINCQLIILDYYMNEVEISLFRQLLNFKGPAKSQNELKSVEYENSFFELKYPKDYSALYCMDVDFELKLNHIQRIIRCKYEDLVKMSCLRLVNFYVDFIKPDALFLFKNIKRLELWYSRFKVEDLFQLVKLFKPAELAVFLSNTEIKRTEFQRLKELDIKCLKLNSRVYLIDKYSDSIKLSDVSLNEFTSLEELDLCAGQFKFTEPGQFFNLKNLVSLRLHSHQLKSICEGLFDGLVNLEFLDLNNNGILDVAVNAFEGLEKLKCLVLIANCLESVKCGQFNSLGSLKKLKLNNNKIKTIEKDAFASLKSLEELDLRGNDVNLAESLTCDYFVRVNLLL